jgi:hypothetical protein
LIGVHTSIWFGKREITWFTTMQMSSSSYFEVYYSICTVQIQKNRGPETSWKTQMDHDLTTLELL